jgi:protein kinase C substrate 80K-H
MKWLLTIPFVFSLRGVEPSKELVYQQWKGCLDGSNNLAILNDDYCDCADGTDEPSTSACPNGRFYCRNVEHVPSFISSARVGDRICDCCDGSDEEAGFCTNQCLALAQIAKEKAQEQEKQRKWVGEWLSLRF